LVLSVLAVVLGIAFVSGSFFVRSSLTSTLGSVVDAVASADVYITPPGASVTDLLMKPSANQEFLDSSTTAIVSAVPDVQGVLPVYAGPIVLLDKSGTAVASGIAPSVGVGADSNQVQKGRLISGSLPSSIKEIALEQNTAKRSGLSIGDSTSLIANGTTLDVTVTGIVSYDTSLSGAVVVILNGIAARAIFSPSGMIPFLAVKGQDGISPAQLQKDLSAALANTDNTEVVLGSDVRRQAVDQVDQTLGVANTILALVAVIAIVVAGYLIVNTVATEQRRRSKQIATLKTMGASTFEVLLGLAKQALIVGVIGSVVGILAGLGVALIINAILAAQGLSLSLGMPWLGLLVSLVGGVLVSLVGTWLGAYKAASASPMDTIRQTEGRQSGYGIVRVIIGVVLLVAGIVGMVLGFQGTPNLWTVGFGMAGVIIGVVLVGPVLVALLTRLFAIPLGWFSSFSANLARSNVLSNPRRASNVAGVFVVCMAMATTMLILVSSANDSIWSTRNSEMQSDFVLQSQDVNGIIPDSVVAQVRQLSGIQVSAFGRAPVQLEQPDPAAPDDPTKDTLVDGTIMFGPPETFSSVVGTTILDGAASDFSSGLAVNKSYADAHNLKVGDTVRLVTAVNTPYEVTAILPVSLIVDSQLFSDILVSSAWLITQVPGHTRSQFMPVTTLFISATNPADTNNVNNQLVATVGPYQTISVQTRDEYVSVSNAQVEQARAAAYAIVVLCIIVAILAIVNTLGLAVSERTREISLLKAIGASRGQVGRMISFEAVLISISGSLVGLVVGIGLSFAGQQVLSSWGLSRLTIPWWWIVGLFVLSIVIGVVAAIGPARRASRLSLPSAVAYE